MSQDINVTNLYAANNTTSKYAKSILWKLKGNFSTFLSETYISNYKNLSVNLN